MKVCQECFSLHERLSRANDQYLSLLLQEEMMIRDGWCETSSLGVVQGALREAENVRSFVTRMLVEHREKHSQTQKTKAAGQPV